MMLKWLVLAHAPHFWSFGNVYFSLTISLVQRCQMGLLCGGEVPVERPGLSRRWLECSPRPSLFCRGRKTQSHGKSRKRMLSLYSQRKMWNQGEVLQWHHGEVLSKYLSEFVLSFLLHGSRCILTGYLICWFSEARRHLDGSFLAIGGWLLGVTAHYHISFQVFDPGLTQLKVSIT